MKKIIYILFFIGVTFLAKAQNIGIGTQTPGAKLHIVSASDEALRVDAVFPYLSLYSLGVYKGYFWKGPFSIEVGSASGSDLPLTFATDGTPRMQIDVNGNIGIGINNQDASFYVARGSGGWGTAVFEGTSHLSHFNYGLNEDTYIRGGKNNGNVILNDIPGGKVGIGTSTPGFPLNFADVTGDKISLFGNSGGHYGFGIQGFLMQIHTNDASADIAFGHGSSSSFTETIRIKGDGKVGIGTTTPGASLEVNGYSKLGSDAPSIKVKKLTGTTAATEGGYVEIAHGVNSLKILSFTVLVQTNTGIWVGTNVGMFAFNFYTYINGGNIIVANEFSDSAGLLSKPIKVLITYEE